MLLTGHAASATVIARLVPNPILAFLIGLVSHIILDIVPHGDTELIPNSHNPNKEMTPEYKDKAKKLFLSYALADTTVMFFLFSGLFVKLPVNPINYAYALFGALCLDLADHSITVLLSRYNERKWLISRFHFRLHTLHKKLGLKDPWLRGFILQFLFVWVILILSVYVW